MKHEQSAPLNVPLLAIRAALLTLLLALNPTLSKAENTQMGGDEFRKSAALYEQKAGKFDRQGQQELAEVFIRMATIKRHAALLADQNRWQEIDWSDYEALDRERIRLLLAAKYDADREPQQATN